MNDLIQRTNSKYNSEEFSTRCYLPCFCIIIVIPKHPVYQFRTIRFTGQHRSATMQDSPPRVVCHILDEMDTIIVIPTDQVYQAVGTRSSD
jgi:hypothetical protein